MRDGPRKIVQDRLDVSGPVLSSPSLTVQSGGCVLTIGRLRIAAVESSFSSVRSD